MATNPWGVSQIASPTTTIKKPILMTVRAETVYGMNRPSMNGARINGRRNANDIGSGIQIIRHHLVITKGSATITMGARIVIRTFSTPSIRFILSQM